MSGGTTPPSEVVPFLVAALVCDSAVADPTTGKKSLIGVFSAIHVKEFPTKRPVCLYFKLADGDGLYQLQFRYMQADTGEMLADARGDLTITDRLATYDSYIPFPPLPILAAGVYEFQIWANGVFLGSTSITAFQQEV